MAPRNDPGLDWPSLLKGGTSHKPQRNIKNSGYQGDMILCGLYQYPSYSSQLLMFSLSSFIISCPIKTGVSGFANRIYLASPLDSSKVFWTCPVILPDMSGFLAKISFCLLILGGKQQRFYQAKRDHIFLRSSLSLSSRSLSSQIPIKVLAQNF
jgi:hypothetical protein